MNKKLKTILSYIILFFLGIGMVILLYKLDYLGKKNIYKARVYSMINIGPDSLINHFPKLDLLEGAIYTTTGLDIKQAIGGSFVIITIAKNDSLNKYMKTIENEERWRKIKKNEIFNINVNYKKRKYELVNFTKESYYPFPKIINANNYEDYKLIFYDFGEGKFLNDNQLKNNIGKDSNWKHGYTRGIVENKKNEYEMWLIIW